MLIDILQQHGKMRLSRLYGIMQYNGHQPQTTKYYMDRLEKLGFIIKDYKSRTERYVSLSLVDIGYMKSEVQKKGNVMCDYQTFLDKLKEYPEDTFTHEELADYMRGAIHGGFTYGRYITFVHRAQEAGIIGNTRRRKRSQGGHLYTLTTSLENDVKRNPTIHGMYEKIIVKELLKNDGVMTWNNLKGVLEDRVGVPLSGNPKVRRAITNLHLKKYIIPGKFYTLNPVYEFKNVV